MAAAEQPPVASTFAPNVPQMADWPWLLLRLSAMTSLLYYPIKMQCLCLSDIRKFGLIAVSAHKWRNTNKQRVGASYVNFAYSLLPSRITFFAASFHFKDSKTSHFSSNSGKRMISVAKCCWCCFTKQCKETELSVLHTPWRTFQVQCNPIHQNS